MQTATDRKIYFLELDTDRVARSWNNIWPLIEQSLPPSTATHEFQRADTLEAVVSGQLKCWACYYKKGENDGLMAIITTKVVRDEVGGGRSLLIYTLTSVKGLTEQVLSEGIQFFKRKAKAYNCTNVLAYTALPEVVELAKKIDAFESYVLHWEVG